MICVRKPEAKSQSIFLYQLIMSFFKICSCVIDIFYNLIVILQSIFEGTRDSKLDWSKLASNPLFLMYPEAEAVSLLIWVAVPVSFLSLLSLLCCKWRSKKTHDDEVDLKNEIYEIHTISGSLSPSLEEIKRCIHLLGLYPFLVNHQMPPYKFTPFLRACWSGNPTLVRFMLRLGADRFSRTVTKESAVYLAAYRATKRQKWDPSVLDLLHKAGCKLSSKNIQQRCALHLAAHAGHVTLARWLVDRGALKSVSLKGTTPYDIAISYRDFKHQSVAALLHTFCPKMAHKVDRKQFRHHIKTYSTTYERNCDSLCCE